MPRRSHHPLAFQATAALASAGLLLGGCAAQPSYDELVQKAIAAQRENEKKKCRVAIWVDSATGKITRFEIVESSGDAAYDQFVGARVLQMKVNPPPPPETPMPILLNVGDQAPSAGAS